jgi:hypothetical protein
MRTFSKIIGVGAAVMSLWMAVPASASTTHAPMLEGTFKISGKVVATNVDDGAPQTWNSRWSFKVNQPGPWDGCGNKFDVRMISQVAHYKVCLVRENGHYVGQTTRNYFVFSDGGDIPTTLRLNVVTSKFYPRHVVKIAGSLHYSTGMTYCGSGYEDSTFVGVRI